MDFKEFNEVDLKLTLLGGCPIEVGSIKIKPYTLKEIRDYGYSKYMKNLQWISLSVDDFIESIKDENKRNFLEEQRAKLKTFDFYIRLGGEELLDSLLTVFAMIFRTDDIMVLKESIAINFEKIGVIERDENGEISVNQERLESLREDEVIIINRDNFDDIAQVIKLQNYLQKPKIENSVKPVDEETRALIEHMERMRKKVEDKKKRQQQQEGDVDIDIADIVSAVSSKSNSINKINIWRLSVYQLYDEYARLELIDNYDFSIKAMMAGAEKVDLKHWSSKL